MLNWLRQGNCFFIIFVMSFFFVIYVFFVVRCLVVRCLGRYYVISLLRYTARGGLHIHNGTAA